MKTAIITLTILLTVSLANAASVTVISDDNAELGHLSYMPQQILGLFTDSGVGLEKKKEGLYQMTVENIHCDYRHNGTVEGPLGGIETLKCRRNSESIQGSTKGDLIGDARGFLSLIDTLQNETDIYFTDCAMGYCGTFVDLIQCTVNTKIETFSKGRFTCTFTVKDGI